MLMRLNEITSWLTDIFATAGCPNEEARLIAVHLVDADASGHPSHGIVRVPRYIDYIHAGTVRPVCAYETLVDSETLCLIDGQYSFGQVLGHHVVNRAEDMCQKNGLGIIALRNAGHLGRIGGWAELLAEKVLSLFILSLLPAQESLPLLAVNRRAFQPHLWRLVCRTKQRIM